MANHECERLVLVFPTLDRTHNVLATKLRIVIGLIKDLDPLAWQYLDTPTANTKANTGGPITDHTTNSVDGAHDELHGAKEGELLREW